MASSSSDKKTKRRWTKESTRKRLATLAANKAAKTALQASAALDPLGTMLADRANARKGGRTVIRPTNMIEPDFNQLAKLIIAVWKSL